ncbi:MAG: discoidin domain-containing protein [Prevotellaceae bacterium]|nr:discoidin domain-containing protein [Prevotellaceae bacterium]
MKNCVLLFLLIMAAGCTKSPSLLEQALEISGDNRIELEKILYHYRNEPLKLKAAQFLIANMPGHVSYRNQEYVEKYYDEIDSVNLHADLGNEELVDIYKTIVAKYSETSPPVQYLRIISAAYLTDNIDRAFDDWQNGTWAAHLNFEEFCEYLLPYKASEYQTLDNWREYFSDTVYGDMFCLPYNAHYSRYAYWACHTVQQKLIKLNPKRYIDVRGQYSIRRMHSLMHTLLKKDCEDSNIANVSILRAKGIPAMTDFTPFWPNRNLGHEWCTLLENTGKNRPFQGLDALENSHIGAPMAKVFRRCYAINPELVELNMSGKNIPSLFRKIHFIDVTDEYIRTDDITVNLDVQHGQYAYLSVFNDAHWRPVHWGKLNGSKVTFKNMGRDAVYLPLCMSEERQLIPAAPPFILTPLGEVKPVVPDMSQRQTLKLIRKFPVSRFTSWVFKLIIGAEIQAANRADFCDALTLHTIREYGTEAGEILLDTLKNKYRYWRFYSAPKGQCSVAELNFIRQGKNITGQEKIIGSTAEDKNYAKAHVFDGDPLTFFSSPDASDSWVGLDFGEPVNIDRILYLPRTDGNIVTYGDEYELKYWDSNGWNSLGRKVADNVHVTFENCPVGALFLLHDCTRGVEERIFTYENGKQVWW